MTLHLTELRDVTCHMGSHKCYLPPDTSGCTPPNTSHAGWYSIYLPRSWLVDYLVDFIAPQPGVKPVTFWSRVRHWTAAPPRQPVIQRIIYHFIFHTLNCSHLNNTNISHPIPNVNVNVYDYSVQMLKSNVKCNSDHSVQNDESRCGHCTNERRVRKWDKKVRRDVI